jgi:hypothetical protein
VISTYTLTPMPSSVLSPASRRFCRHATAGVVRLLERPSRGRPLRPTVVRLAIGVVCGVSNWRQVLAAHVDGIHADLRANKSIARSAAAVASGRPAPR